MYKFTVQTISSNETTIYYPGNVDYTVISAVLTYEIGLAGEFNLVIPVTNPAYNLIVQNAIITVYENNKEIWRGDIRDIKCNFDKSLSVYAVEDLAWLGEEPAALVSVTNETYAQRFNVAITAYNANQVAKRQFTVGQLTAQSGTCTWQPVYGDSILSALRAYIAKDKGYLKVRRAYSGNTLTRYIDIVTLADYGKQSTQKVEFGSNMIDFVKDMDATNICNAVTPYGAETETPLYGDTMQRIAGTPIQNDTSIAAYGRRAKTVVFDTDSTVTLNNLASSYLSRYSQPILTLEVKAADLGSVENVDSFAIGDSVRVLAEVYAVDQRMYITKIDVNCLDAAQTQITLSDVVRNTSLTTQVISQAEDIKEIRTPESILEAAKRNAMAILEGDDGGTIIFVTNEDGQLTKQMILNNLDVNQATKAWQWTLNGLAYMHRTYPTDDWTVGIAITMDGGIVADFITTGTLNAANVNVINLNADNITSGSLNANLIQSGAIQADIVRGGTYIVGGTNDFNGKLLVLGTNTNLSSADDVISAVQSLGYAETGELNRFTITADLSDMDSDITIHWVTYLTTDGHSFETIEYGDIKPGASSFKFTIPTILDINSKSGNRYYQVSMYVPGYAKTFDVQFSYAPIATIMNKDGTDTNHLKVSGDSSFGDLNIGKKTVSPYGEPLEVSTLYADGWIELLYEQTTPSVDEVKFIYVCPAADGWLDDGDINVNFSAENSSTYDRSGIALCRIDKQSWNTSSNKWVSSTHRRFNYLGEEIDHKNKWFPNFTASDSTLYRFKITYYKKKTGDYNYTWASNYTLDMWVETADSQKVRMLEIQPYEVTGTSFNGRFRGTGQFTNFTLGNKFEYFERFEEFWGHSTKLGVDDRQGNDDADDTFTYKVWMEYDEIYKLPYASLTPTPVKWDTGSDVRLKEDISPIDIELSRDIIDGTKPKSFKYKFEDSGYHYGMIAQDVRELLDSVGEDDAMLERALGRSDEYRTINYEEYIPHIINYIKDLRAEITALKSALKKEEKSNG